MGYTHTISARCWTIRGVAIRTGHHCAMPVMEFFGVPGTARASMVFYNNTADIEQLVDGLRVAIKMFD